ncbi:arylsulfotransferase family protein [Aspergillus alliaceus]|uniref:arylsulfotransferase family protein n=1 Tax=Petromyces alliaceus TaxID=209559 RepID=UPI0012A6FD8A|nr:ASST-domain-containing protein [Aspergillus alliaceus]KAB8237956.1 ASST-domain-containing protein [Aspergillus alliaceus]
MSSWAWTPTKARHSWLRLVHVATVGVIISILYLFYVFAVPQILRFRFRTDLSQYDLGLYGFGPSRGYVSFNYQSPLVEITESASGCDPGYTFLAPRGDSVPQEGPMILDAQGNLVWMKYNWETTQDFKMQKYKGEYFLTYWEGREIESRGYGSWYMLDSTYTQRYVINPVGNYGGDLHEFTLTEQGTALVTIYDPTPADLTTVGGPELGWIFDGVFQEIDVETGELLFEWRASKHYPVSSTYEPLVGAGKDRASAFDYFHINSVDKDDQGNFIISARHTHSISCIDPKSGSLLWTLGGKMNDFVDLSNGEATNFAWQHDARWHANNTLTLFDNAVHSNKDPATESRGMSIQLDISSRQAKLLGAYYHPQRMKSVSQGNVQMLDEAGRVVVGWGHSAAFSEFTADGRLLCNVHYGASAFFTFGRVVSYRVFKGDWVGRPQTTPDAEVDDEKVYASWNGATEVTAWRVEVWNSDDLNDSSFGVVAQYEKTGFETEIEIPKDLGPLFRLAALDSGENVLGVTDILQKEHGADLEELLDLHNWILGLAMAISGGGLLAVDCIPYFGCQFF